MKKRLRLAILLVVAVCFLGCSGSSGDDGDSSTTETIEYVIETQGDVVWVATEEFEQFLLVRIKDVSTNELVPDVLVRAEFSEFYPGELAEIQKKWESYTGENGGIVFLIPPYGVEGDRLVTLSLPDFPDTEERTVIIRYVSDIDQPVRVAIADEEQAKISLALGEEVEIAFVVLNAWDVPLSGFMVDVIEGEEYVISLAFMITDEKGLATFSFVASEQAGSTVLRVQLTDYPELMAEIVVSWSDGIPFSIEIISDFSLEDDIPVVSATVGEPLDISFLVKDQSEFPISGELVLIEFPAGESAETNEEGVATITIPASVSDGYDFFNVAWVMNYDVLINFKIEYIYQ